MTTPTDDEITDQQELLATHRQSLHQLLRQQARPDATYSAFAVANSIADARAAIAQIKATLRSWGVPVDDLADDVAPPDPSSTLRPRAGLPLLLGAGLGALVILVVGVIAWLVSLPPSVAVQPTSTPPTPTAPTAMLTSAPTTLPTAAPTLPPTAAPAPVFVARVPVSVDDLEHVELVPDPTLAATVPVTRFLTVSRIEYGDLLLADSRVPAWNVRFTLTNMSTRPIQLDLTDRFFVLNDDQGRAAPLVYFCCASQPGEVLGVGQAREMQLLFQSVPGWYGKSTQAHTIFIRVTGLLPIVRAVWSFPPLATAD